MFNFFNSPLGHFNPHPQIEVYKAKPSLTKGVTPYSAPESDLCHFFLRQLEFLAYSSHYFQLSLSSFFRSLDLRGGITSH